jgi:hypothetical protein
MSDRVATSASDAGGLALTMAVHPGFWMRRAVGPNV